MTFVTYIHTRKDNSIFYVGKGVEKRAYDTKSRNKYWQNIVAKEGFSVKILAYWDTEEEAFEHEKVVIASLRDLNCKLANLTDGGEGNSGYKWTEDQLKTLSEAHKGINKGLFSGNKNPNYGKVKELNKKYKGSILATNIKSGEQLVLEGANDIEQKGFNRCHVYRCVLGTRNTHKGFTFKRVENNEQQTENSNIGNIKK